MSTLITRPKVEIASELKEQLDQFVQEEGQVIVHCLYASISGLDGIRIWPSTYLYDNSSDHRSNLVHAENISYFPQWTWVGVGENHFTLVFSGLPKSCTSFDLIEDCNGSPGAFKVNGIARNNQDVYYVRI